MGRRGTHSYDHDLTLLYKYAQHSLEAGKTDNKKLTIKNGILYAWGHPIAMRRIGENGMEEYILSGEIIRVSVMKEIERVEHVLRRHNLRISETKLEEVLNGEYNAKAVRSYIRKRTFGVTY